MNRIARDAGVNKQLIFYYFGSKAGLFKAVVESASAKLASVGSRTGPPTGPLEELRGLLERAYHGLSEDSDLLRATLVAPEATEGARAPISEQLEALGQRIRALASDAQGLGYVRDDVDPAVVAHMAVALVVGSVVRSGPSKDHRLRSETDILIRGLAW